MLCAMYEVFLCGVLLGFPGFLVVLAYLADRLLGVLVF